MLDRLDIYQARESFRICDNVGDFQMQRTSFAFQMAAARISDCIPDADFRTLPISLSHSHSLSLPLSLTIFYSLSDLKFNLLLKLVCRRFSLCIMQLAYIAHTPRCPIKLAKCKYLYSER